MTQRVFALRVALGVLVVLAAYVAPSTAYHRFDHVKTGVRVQYFDVGKSGFWKELPIEAVPRYGVSRAATVSKWLLAGEGSEPRDYSSSSRYGALDGDRIEKLTLSFGHARKMTPWLTVVRRNDAGEHTELLVAVHVHFHTVRGEITELRVHPTYKRVDLEHGDVTQDDITLHYAFTELTEYTPAAALAGVLCGGLLFAVLALALALVDSQQAHLRSLGSGANAALPSALVGVASGKRRA